MKNSSPSRFNVDINGRLNSGLTEQEAWETFLVACYDPFVNVKMRVSGVVVAQREGANLQGAKP